MTNNIAEEERPSFRLRSVRGGELEVAISGTPTGHQMGEILAEAEAKAGKGHTEMLVIFEPEGKRWNREQRGALEQAGFQPMSVPLTGRIWRKPLPQAGPDGEVCSDFGLLPPHMVTCITCITRMVMQSVKDWESAIANHQGAAAASIHSRRAGEAFIQLSLLEAELGQETDVG